nr:MAG TPA: hypothetical protein [Bacteriophage sp.]
MSNLQFDATPPTSPLYNLCWPIEIQTQNLLIRSQILCSVEL